MVTFLGQGQRGYERQYKQTGKGRQCESVLTPAHQLARMGDHSTSAELNERRFVPSKPLLSGLLWRLAVVVTFAVLLIAVVYAAAQLVAVLVGGTVV
jgi:hypothetical protein